MWVDNFVIFKLFINDKFFSCKETSANKKVFHSISDYNSVQGDPYKIIRSDWILGDKAT